MYQAPASKSIDNCDKRLEDLFFFVEITLKSVEIGGLLDRRPFFVKRKQDKKGKEP